MSSPRSRRKTPPPESAPPRLPLVAVVALGLLSVALGYALGAAVRETRAPEVAAPSPHATPRPGPLSEAARRVQEGVFQEGVKLFSEQRFAKALEAFERASALDPMDPRPHHGLGKIYLDLKLLESAEKEFRHAIAVDPAYRPSKESLIMLLHDGGRYEEALDLLAGLERESPEDPWVMAEIGINRLALGNTREAIALLERYNEKKGPQAWGHAHLGRAYAAAGEPRRAEEAYRKAIALDQYFPVAFYSLGQLLVAEGREEEARDFLERYRRLRALLDEEHQLKMKLHADADNVAVLVNLARVRAGLGKFRESMAALEAARKLAPDDRQLEELYRRVSGSLPDAER